MALPGWGAGHDRLHLPALTFFQEPQPSPAHKWNERTWNSLYAAGFAVMLSTVSYSQILKDVADLFLATMDIICVIGLIWLFIWMIYFYHNLHTEHYIFNKDFPHSLFKLENKSECEWVVVIKLLPNMSLRQLNDTNMKAYSKTQSDMLLRWSENWWNIACVRAILFNNKVITCRLLYNWFCCRKCECVC